jgi:hypothetical protein
MTKTTDYYRDRPAAFARDFLAPTVTRASPHGLAVGELLRFPRRITGLSVKTFVVTSVVDACSFTIGPQRKKSKGWRRHVRRQKQVQRRKRS